MALAGSVGANGANNHSDVTQVQELLKKNGCDPGKVDGKCGDRTIGAIREFQKRFMATPDGRVDAGGKTWQRLNGKSGQAPASNKPYGGPHHPVHAKDSDKSNAGTPSNGNGAKGDWSGDSARWSQEKKLLSMEPGTRDKVKQVLEKMRAKGFKPKIFYAWRSVAVQKHLYDLKHTTVLFSFHNAQKPDGTPNALAADIVDERWGWEKGAAENGYWDALGDCAKEVGLVWGGDWKSFPDVAHVQSRPNSDLKQVKKESGL